MAACVVDPLICFGHVYPSFSMVVRWEPEKVNTKYSKQISIKVMLQLQIILQHFYKLLMWQILISYNMGPPLISHLYLSMII